VTGSIVPGLQLGLANTGYVWNSTSTPQLGLNNRSLSIQRGHILGGGSSVSEYQLCAMSDPAINLETDGMVYTRGSSSDYDRFAEYSGDPGWSWDNIQQYLRKVGVTYLNGCTYSEYF